MVDIREVHNAMSEMDESLVEVPALLDLLKVIIDCPRFMNLLKVIHKSRVLLLSIHVVSVVFSSPAFFQDLRKETVKHTQLATARENLKHIFMVPETVRQTEALITEGRLLEAHRVKQNHI